MFSTPETSVHVLDTNSMNDKLPLHADIVHHLEVRRSSRHPISREAW